jgi:hypothetical protein
MGSVTIAKVLVLVLTLGFSLNEMARSKRFMRNSQRTRRPARTFDSN